MADMTAVMEAKDLHLPLAEKLLAVPVDIYGGRMTGKLRIAAYDEASWRFPLINGNVVVSGKSRGGGWVIVSSFSHGLKLRHRLLSW